MNAMHATVPSGADFLFNPRAPGFNDDPYSQYRRLRELAPMHRNFMGIWVVADHATARGVLRDPRFRSRDIPAQIAKKGPMVRRLRVDDSGSDLSHLLQHSLHWLAFIEPPDHTRLRKLVAKAFQQRSAESMRPYARTIAEELLAPLRGRVDVDLMKEFAVQLPMRVIAATLGVPQNDLPELARWTEVLARIFDPLMSLEDYVLLDRASAEAIRYFVALIAVRRAEPQTDLLSALVHARDDQDALTDNELIAVCILLFCAGSETTSNLLGMGTLALLKNPEQIARLKNDPTLYPNAVEELLRYDAPLQMTSRTATENVELAGNVVRSGEQVYLLIGSANRDPSAFSAPEQLDVGRVDNPHLSFAAGHHFCLGASLARIEAQEGLRVLFEMHPNMQLASETFSWRAHTVLRGLNALPVRL
jgi:cytochrome P450